MGEDHNLVHSYYNNQPLKQGDLIGSEDKLVAAEMLINGEGPYLVFVTPFFAKNGPGKKYSAKELP